jgi:ribosomal-protein-alanine N-acetyltransferase
MIVGVDIIPGGIRDVDAIMPVMTSAFDPIYGEAWSSAQCAGMLSLPGTILFWARKENQACGFALARAVLDECELLLIATTSEFRGRGIGKGLLHAVIDWSRTNAVKRVILEVRSGNSALELYQSMGFTEIGRRENYYIGLENRRFDALTMQLNI